FALFIDLDIAQTWGVLRTLISSGVDTPLQVLDAYEVLLQASKVLTAAESFAVLVAAGGGPNAGHTANPCDPRHPRSLLSALGSLTPKILFNPNAEGFWLEVAFAIVASKTAGAFINALPLIGEIIAVIELVGDVATLAEAIGETIASPWVIANEISLTYA